MWAQNGFSGFYSEPEVLKSIKPTAENDTSEPNIQFRMFCCGL
jgi:hypothetical protein